MSTKCYTVNAIQDDSCGYYEYVAKVFLDKRAAEVYRDNCNGELARIDKELQELWKIPGPWDTERKNKAKEVRINKFDPDCGVKMTVHSYDIVEVDFDEEED